MNLYIYHLFVGNRKNSNFSNTLLKQKVPDIPEYNGEDPNYSLDSFINKIKQQGKMLYWKESDYGKAVVTHLKGRPRIEFLRNQDWMTLTWKELQKDLMTRVTQSTNEITFLTLVKKSFHSKYD